MARPSTRKLASAGASTVLHPYLQALPGVVSSLPCCLLILFRADAPERWRTQIGGFDPATPYAEALINYHNHAAMFMFFVVFTVLHVVRK